MHIKSEKGAGLIEYASLVSLIVLIAHVGVVVLGEKTACKTGCISIQIANYDYDGDGSLNFGDMHQFVSDFTNQLPSADLNCDCQFDAQDVNIFAELLLNS